jgi:hypothetical protein
MADDGVQAKQAEGPVYRTPGCSFHDNSDRRKANMRDSEQARQLPWHSGWQNGL